MRLLIAIFCLVCWAATPNLQAQTAANLTTITVKVTGVGCSSDVRSIGNMVEKLEGVTACEVEKRGATTRFSVSYNPDVACTDDIYSAIEDTPGCKNPNDRPYRVKL
jgi:copper chaperone CopZ